MSISEPTVKLLWSRAHNTCAAQGCSEELTRESSGAAGGGALVILGEQAHIRGKRPGSARHDPSYGDVDGYENLILLCPTHHTEIDKNDGKDFSVAELLKLKSDHEKRWARHDHRQLVVKAYLAQTFGVDDTTRFEQVDLQPQVDTIFVDVAVGALRGSDLEPTLTAISETAPGDVAAEDRSTYAVTGGAQALLHPDWSGGALLVGGPGQGKSTLLQFVCQFHRARLLGKKDAYTGSRQELRDVTTRHRFPVRVELREYVAWAKASVKGPRGETRGRAARKAGKGDRKRSGAWPALEQFVANHIQEHSGGLSFDIKDLTSLVTTEPVLLALDGLDEVAALADREEVSRQILGTRNRLDAIGLDVVVLVATRPGAETASLWFSLDFPQLQLLPLTQGLRLQYFQRWADAADLRGVARDELQEKLLSQQHELHIKELASTPMQLAILLHLLQRKRRLPQERTALYSQYIQTFLDREEGQDKEPLLGEQRDLIERVHERLAWHLQSSVEEGSSSGSIGREDLRQLLRIQLMDQTDGLDFAQRLFDSFEARVMCLVEREGSFEFQIQSLREYFVAVHIANTVGLSGSKDERLKALLARPYWTNVTRFFVGGLSPSEVKGLRYTLLDVAEDRTLGVHPMLRSTAFLFFEDRCFQGQPHLVLREMVDFVLEGPGLFFAEDGLLNPTRAPLRFSDRAGRLQAVEHLKDRLLQPETFPDRELAATSLARHATQDDAVAEWWWTQFKAERAWLEVAVHLGCLDQVTRHNKPKLASALREASRSGPVAWLFARLEDDASEVVRALIDEVNAASVMSGSSEHTVLGRLLAASRGTQPRHVQAVGQRSRTRRVRGELQGLPAIERAAVKVATLGPQSTAVAWAAALTQVSEAWGQGWVICDHVARIPATIDLDLLISCIVDDKVGITDLVAREGNRRRSASNPDFWRASAPSMGGAEAVDWLAAVLTRAHTSTIIKLHAELDAVVERLSPAELAVAADAISRRGRTTTLSLSEDLRLNRFVASAPLLMLLRAAAEGATMVQLKKKLAVTASGQRAKDFLDASEVVEAMEKVAVEWFRDGRSSMSSSAQPTVQLTGLSQARAREVLNDPGRWPTFVVRLAAQRLRADIEKQPPLSEVARKDRWFESSV